MDVGNIGSVDWTPGSDAQAIMGRNFISADAMQSVLGTGFNSTLAKEIGRIPFSPDFLRRYKDSHILFPCPKYSVRSILMLPGNPRELLLQDTAPLPAALSLKLFDEETTPGWHLLHRTPLRHKQLSYHQQAAQLPPGHSVTDFATVMFAAKLIAACVPHAGTVFFRGDAMWTSTDDGAGAQIAVLPHNPVAFPLQITQRYPREMAKVGVGYEFRPAKLSSSGN